MSPRTIAEISRELADAETLVLKLRHELRVAQRDPLQARNRAIFNDRTAGLSYGEIRIKHGVSYSVVANVLHDLRLELSAAHVRNASQAHGAPT